MLAILPAVALHLCFLALGPRVYDGVALPLFALLDVLAAPLLTLCLSVVLLGTFLETPWGFAGLIERMDRWREERQGAPFFSLGSRGHGLGTAGGGGGAGSAGGGGAHRRGLWDPRLGLHSSLHPARAGLGAPPLAVARNSRESELIASGAAVWGPTVDATLKHTRFWVHDDDLRDPLAALGARFVSHPLEELHRVWREQLRLIADAVW